MKENKKDVEKTREGEKMSKTISKSNNKKIKVRKK